MIQINQTLAIDEANIQERFIRASGPGGQNVNKVASAVQLRYDTGELPEAVRARLKSVAGRRLNAEGELVIEARRFRNQEQNRKDALDRLVKLIARAAEPPRPRRKTRTPAGSMKRRLEDKRRRGVTKQLRKPGDKDAD